MQNICAALSWLWASSIWVDQIWFLKEMLTKRVKAGCMEACGRSKTLNTEVTGGLWESDWWGRCSKMLLAKSSRVLPHFHIQFALAFFSLWNYLRLRTDGNSNLLLPLIERGLPSSPAGCEAATQKWRKITFSKARSDREQIKGLKLMSHFPKRS